MCLKRIICGIFTLLLGLSFDLPKAYALWVWAQERVYDCELSANSVDFGTIADTDLIGKSLQTKITADCFRPFLTGITTLPVPFGAYCVVIQGNTVNGAVEGTRYLSNNSDPNSKIYFSFYNSEVSGSLPIGADFSGRYGYLTGAPEINLASNFIGYFYMDFPVTVRLFSSSVDGKDGSISAGNYSGVFSGTMRYGATYRLPGWGGAHWQANSAADCYGLPKGPVVGNLTVRATVKSSCNVSVENHINFGRMPAYRLQEGVSAPEGRIKAHCSKGTSYQVGLSGGEHKDKAMSGYRAMQRRSGGEGEQDFIAYGLYKDRSHSQPWADNWGSNDTMNGIGAEENALYPVHAFVPQQETDKNAGVYQDTVRVEIRINAQ